MLTDVSLRRFDILRPFISVFVILAAWEGLAALYADSFILSGPLAVGAHISQNAALLARATWATFQNAALGFVWGNLVAMALATIVVLVPRLESTVTALALLVFCLPLVATGPILRVLFGPHDGPQITLAALAVYYTSFLAILVGLRAVSQNWLELIRTYGRGPVTELVEIRVVAALPYLIAGFQIAAPAAFLGAMIGEFTGAEKGLGVLTIRAMRSLDVDATWAIASLAASVSILTYLAIGWLGARAIGAPPALLLASPSIRRPKSTWRVVGRLLLLILLPIILWQALFDLFDLNPFFAKRPLDVAIYFFTDSPARIHLFQAFGETLIFVLPGYLGGLFLGASLASAIILAPSLSRKVLPASIALRSIPIITTAPLLVLALGRGAIGTISIVTVMIFFPTLVACLQGLRQTPGEVADIFKSYGAGRWRLLIFARLPAMLPAFFAAARMGIPAAILAVTTAEWLATGRGIGTLMALTASTSDYSTLWASIVLVSVTAALAYAAVSWVERAILKTYAAEQIAR